MEIIDNTVIDLVNLEVLYFLIIVGVAMSLAVILILRKFLTKQDLIIVFLLWFFQPFILVFMVKVYFNFNWWDNNCEYVIDAIVKAGTIMAFIMALLTKYFLEKNKKKSKMLKK
jgi:pilus assembly protein TadC